MSHKMSQSQVLVDMITDLNKKNLVIAELGIWKAHTVKRVFKNQQ